MAELIKSAGLIKSVEGSMSAQGYTNTAYSIKLEVYLNSQSIENNTSNLTYKVYLRTNGNSWGWSQFTSPRTYIYRNGGLISTSNSISSLPTNNSGVWVQVQSYTEDIKHNDDGTLNINMSATFKSNTSGYRYMPKDKTISTGNFDLETIPRASVFSGMPTEFYIQDGLPISFTKYAENFTEKLTVDFPDIQTAIEIEDPVSGQTIEIYSDIQQDIFNSLAYNEDSVICNLALETYSGETLIGFSLASLNAKMKPTQDTQPLITGSLSTSEANTIIQSLTNGINYIKGYSNLLIELSPIATFKYNAQLSKVLVNDTNEMEVLNDVASYTLNNVNTSSIKVSVVDTRNFSSSITATIPLIEYKDPILSEVTTSRENGVSEEVYLNFKAKLWNGNFGNGNNTITEFKYRVKEHSSNEYSEWFDLLGAVKVAIEGQSVDNLIAENIKIYSDGTSANFEFGISYDIQVYLKDGITNIPFNQTSYVNSTIEDGYVLDSYVKSSNGYKYAINDVADDSLAEGLQINGKLYLNKEDIFDILYPIGRGFIDFTNIDYSNYLGLTWERELVGMFPVGYDPTDEDFNEIGKTGGSKSLQTHTHAISGDGSHYHIGLGRNASGSGYSNLYESYASGASVREVRTPYSGSNGGHTHTISPTGGSKAGEDFSSSPNNGNVPPYQVVAYWKRVA